VLIPSRRGEERGERREERGGRREERGERSDGDVCGRGLVSGRGQGR
jgi:hypothetical protein